MSACKDLYDNGVKALYTACRPKIEISTDIIDFLSCNRCVYDWAKLGLGNIITVEHSDSCDVDTAYSNMLFRIIAYQYSPYTNELNLEITNEENIKTGGMEMANFFRDSARTTSTVGGNKNKWDNAQSNAVSDMIHRGLDLALSTIKNSEYQDVKIDSHGITIVII